jgi:hypothetical protein
VRRQKNGKKSGKTFALEAKSCFLKVVAVENRDIRVPTKTPTVKSREDEKRGLNCQI